MAVTPTPIFPQAMASVTFPVTASFALAFTAGANGAKISAMGVTKSDAGATDLLLSLTSSATGQFGAVSIPASSGITSAAPSVDVMRSAQLPFLSYDSFGNKVMLLAPGATLYVKGTTTMVLFIEAVNF